VIFYMNTERSTDHRGLFVGRISGDAVSTRPDETAIKIRWADNLTDLGARLLGPR